MEARINFKETTTGHARNGYYIQTGIELSSWRANGEIELTGITSKKKPVVGSLTIPKEHIQELIDILEKLK
jgi:hypothetical protein